MEQYFLDRIAYYSTRHQVPTIDVIDDLKIMLSMYKKSLEVINTDVKWKAKKQDSNGKD